MKFYAGLDVGGTSGRVKFSAEDKTDRKSTRLNSSHRT